MEEFIISTQFLTEFNFEKPKEYKVRAIIFLVNSKKIDNLFDQNLLGKKMKNWVLESLSPFETTFIELSVNEDCYKKAKDCIKDEDYTICLFSDTPLIKTSTILEVLDYAQTKNLDFCSLPRGFIVKSKNFIKDNILLSAEASFVDPQEFFTVFDETTLLKAKENLRKRILEMHLKNGVRIEDLNTVFIDSTVQIGKNVFINNNNTIIGNSLIKDGVTLQPFNYIENSIIYENCVISSSFVKDYNLEKNSKVGPFEKLDNNKEKRKWNWFLV